MTQKDLTTLTRYISHILDTSLDISVNTHLHDIVDFCRINLVNEPAEKELDELAEDASYEAYPTDEYDNPSLRQGYYLGFKDGYRKEKGL